MMAASKSSKKRRNTPQPGLEIRGPRVMYIPERLGGGLVRDYAEIESVTGKLRRYALVYINPAISARDNGRVLGYDNAHGYPHRHYMGKITREPALSWDELCEKFEREWRQIASQFLEGRL
jgi:hypothetical protein